MTLDVTVERYGEPENTELLACIEIGAEDGANLEVEVKAFRSVFSMISP